MRAARAARLFSLARPIKFVICGVVVAVPVIREFKQSTTAGTTAAAVTEKVWGE